MDYPDTDEMNFAKDDKDLNEYCTFHEMPYQNLDQESLMTDDQFYHQGMMTEEHDLIDKYENDNKNKSDKELNLENKEKKLKDVVIKPKINEELNILDSRETPSGFI